MQGKECANETISDETQLASVMDLILDLGIAEPESRELESAAQQYWSSRGRSIWSDDSHDRAQSLLLYLTDTCVPVKEIAGVVSKCPALLLASVEDVKPMINFLKKVKISGKALSNLCTTYPEILLEGRVDSAKQILKILRSLDLHESQIERIIRECPSVMTYNPENFTRDMKTLTRFFSSLEDLVLHLTMSPRLINDSSRRFQGIKSVLEKVGMDDEEALLCVKKEPRLLTKRPSTIEAVLSWFIESGLRPSDVRKMVKTYPVLLTRRLSLLKTKAKFLVSIAGRKFEDILSFPIYFNYSIDRTIGPRFTFLKQRNNPALTDAPLHFLIKSTNSDFASKVARVLEAEYLVYQAQWTRMYGDKFEFRGRPRVKN